MALQLIANLSFAEIALEVDPDGGLRFLPKPLGRFCLFNGLDPEVVLADEDCTCELICHWYVLHRDNSFSPDRAVERVLDQLRDGMD